MTKKKTNRIESGKKPRLLVGGQHRSAMALEAIRKAERKELKKMPHTQSTVAILASR